VKEEQEFFDSVDRLFGLSNWTDEKRLLSESEKGEEHKQQQKMMIRLGVPVTYSNNCF